MTYSVIMRDDDTGRFGVAVQSHWFGVANIVPWVEHDVGAVATQSLAEPLYGPRGLALMRDGVGATTALEQLLDDDETPHVRQVAMVDADGTVAVHTGSGCVAHASHVSGDGWSVQANMMRDERVVPAMAAVAETAAGPIADRLFAVLRAAEEAGGDLRGSQSAAILVTGDGPVPSLRLSVDDHPDPITELRRLLEIRRMYDDMEAGDAALADGDLARAAVAFDRAAGSPHVHPEVLFWQAHGLANVGEYDRAAAIMRRAVAANADLDTLLDRVTAAGLLDIDRAAALRDAMR